MVSEVLLQTDILGVPLFVRGKIRDTYDFGDSLLIVATDRISAFDVVLPNSILDKGKVLNQLSGFWFDRTRHIVPNHLEQMVDSVEVVKPYLPRVSDSDLVILVGRSMVVRKAKRIDIECVVRGYISGSAWAEYQKHGTVAGFPMSKGLRESDKLPEVLFTPTTKSETGHDEPITVQQMEDMLGKDLTKEIQAKTERIYSFSAGYAAERGIIIADTKMEFGLDEDKLILIDELLTPDSSRFWDHSKYNPGGPQPSFDKQPVRDWLVASGWNKGPPAPALPEEVVAATTKRYRKAYARLTGRSLD